MKFQYDVFLLLFHRSISLSCARSRTLDVSVFSPLKISVYRWRWSKTSYYLIACMQSNCPDALSLSRFLFYFIKKFRFCCTSIRYSDSIVLVWHTTKKNKNKNCTAEWEQSPDFVFFSSLSLIFAIAILCNLETHDRFYGFNFLCFFFFIFYSCYCSLFHARNVCHWLFERAT